MWPMRCLLRAAVVLIPLSGAFAQDAKKADPPASGRDVPNLAITPHTIRVQPMDPDEMGSWLDLPGYGELGSPFPSPDGQWIAFDAYKGGYNHSRAECWVARRDGTGLRKLADGATPRWSPSGDRLLFIRGEQDDAGRESQIYVIKADGTGERKLCPGRWPDWSPDGKRITFSRGGLPGGGARIGATVCVSDADGSGLKEMVTGDCPSWSPDGKRIAFCFREEGRPPLIDVIDLETKEIKTLGYGWFRANWMPDGRAVVANGQVLFGGLGMVKLASIEVARPSQLFSQFEDTSSPSPSADGKFMVFIARRPQKGL